MISGNIRQLRSESLGRDPFHEFAVSPAGGTIAVANWDTIDLWDAASATWVRSIEDNPRRHRVLETMAFSHRGTLARVVLADKNYSDNTPPCSRIRLWELASGTMLGELDLPELSSPRPSYISFSEDGTYLESNIWRLPLPLPALNHVDEEAARVVLRQCFFVANDWLMQGLEKLIWLPPDYRSSDVAVINGNVALYAKYTGVFFISVDLEWTPRRV